MFLAAAAAVPSLPAATSPTSGVQMAIVLSLATMLPGIVLTCTCFARFVVVFSMLKTGLGTPGAPPNQVLVGLALFMTMFVMAPVANDVYAKGLQPYLAGQLDESKALDAATPPLRAFLLKHTRSQDLAIFFEVSRTSRPRGPEDVPLRIAVPAFAVSELRTAFEMGLMVLLPFLVIDLVVATVLSSLGLVMMPPSVIAVPVKLLVFVAADGWALIVRSLLRGAMG
jgi:flagellar biosynthetic protein FliP